MKKILLILSMFQFVANAQIVNKFRDSTWFKSGVQFDGNVVFKSGAASGKVWTSNSNGTGSWQTISSSGVSQGALNDSITAVRNIRKVDTLYKNLDSIIYKINGIRYSVLDSTGGGVQTLSISGDTLSISGGNSVVLPVYVQVDSATVTSYDVLNSQNAPPLSPNVGDVYLVGNTPSGAWVGHAKDIAEWNGSAWVFTDGVQGDFLYNATTALTYIFRSGNWVQTTALPALNNGNNISSGLKIGTNNTQPLTFETNNINRGRFDSTGRFYVYNIPTASDTFLATVNSLGVINKIGKNSIVDTFVLSTKGNVTGLLLNKQDNLISGTNIKTVNSNSLLGSGNIAVGTVTSVATDNTLTGGTITTSGTLKVDTAVISTKNYALNIGKQNLGLSYADSISLSISGGNTIKFAYAVDSVGMVSTDSLITYKAGVRRSYKVGSTSGGGALSAITAATATNTIDNTNYKQRWNWSTTAGDTAFALLGNSTGAASNLQNVLTVSNSGANSNASQTTFGAKISNTKTGASSINYGLYAKASGGTTNYAIGADGDIINISGGGTGFKFLSGGSITDYSALQLTAGTNRAIFLTPNKAEGVDILTSAGYISHNFYEVSGTDAGIIMGGRYNAGTYDPFSTTAIVQLQRNSGKLNFIAATGLAGSYTPSSYTIMTLNGAGSGAAGNVGIGTTSPSANAKLEITTTTLAPIKLTPMTATQASAVTAEDGQILYVNSTNGTFSSVGFWGRENGTWVKF